MGESKGGRTTDMPSRNTDTHRAGSAQFSCRSPATKASGAQFWNKDVKGDIDGHAEVIPELKNDKEGTNRFVALPSVCLSLPLLLLLVLPAYLQNQTTD